MQFALIISYGTKMIIALLYLNSAFTCFYQMFFKKIFKNEILLLSYYNISFRHSRAGPNHKGFLIL